MGVLRGSNGHEVHSPHGIYWPFDDEMNHQMKLQVHIENEFPSLKCYGYDLCINDMKTTFDFQETLALSKKTLLAERAYKYRLRHWLPQNRESKVLDLGCGDGIISSYLARNFSTVTGVDHNSAKLETAKTLGLLIEQQDVFDFLASTKTSFDLICAFDLIEHLGKTNVKAFLALCFKRLNSGGRLILQMPNPISPFGFGVFQGDLTHEFTLSPVLAMSLLKEAGFVAHECRETGPPFLGYSLSSTVRFLIWRFLRLTYRLIHFVEAGETSNFPLTRVYLISGLKS